ncbi:16S rRNA C967 or C1407 C5-methylase (RsmB/RsmF family)/NOL1/NOP2/fmu family ribosome biogenesis protein [Dysgonomonadaceae bacterium PH5-43]|nr:16S rRNA C967 or C1407 C5-methylase (RsmB/RsmF family)/NOL1/NOP2/fmu family ribosome biogenesis protein [Dysgonomonadaceae bacterium PH5-43]
MKLPIAFENQIKEIIGDEWNNFVNALEEDSPTSIRLNSNKYHEADNLKTNQPIPWASNAYYLDTRPIFTLDPLLHAGVYYVQEASSMYLEQIIKKHLAPSIKVLDLCAAPGGKSTLISSLLSEDSLLVANEVIRTRSNILSENLIKWGNPNTIVTNNDPADIGNKLNSYFDIIVADVPCSGEGMFRKDNAAINEWSPNNVKLCAERQRRIIADIWSSLKPGGILIYSTCTFNKEENENNLEWICNELGAEILDAPCRFYPHKNKGEGFFIASLQKAASDESNTYRCAKKNKKDNKSSKGIKTPEEIKQRIINADAFSFHQKNDSFIAIPLAVVDSYRDIASCLKIVSAGISIGEIKGKDIIPSHSLALSNCLSESFYPTLELDKESAIKYLRKDSFDCDLQNLHKGYVIVTYNNRPLGFIKNIGTRFNNLYPNEWRIRMNV